MMRRMGGEQYFAHTMPGPLAVAGFEPLDQGDQFAGLYRVEAGETKTFTVVHIVSDELTADPGFAYYYRNTGYRGRMTAAFLLGSTAG